MGTDINVNLERGTHQVNVENAYILTSIEIQQLHENLLEPFVKDKQLRQLLTEEQNMQKIAFRLKHQLVVRNNEGHKIYSGEHIGKKTIRQALTEFTTRLPEGTTIESNDPRIKQLETLGFRKDYVDAGKCKTLQYTVTMKKA